MLNKKEILAIIVITLTLGLVLILSTSEKLFFYFAGIVFLTIIINVVTKKAVAEYLDTTIEIKFWEIRQFWYKKHWHTKNPFAIGVILPLLLKVITAGVISWFACLTFDVKAKIGRAAKRHGLYAFSDISEAQIGAIAAAGIGANIIFSIVGYLLGYYDFARINLGFAFYNLIPISNLDGNKIFFGSLVLWNFLAAIVLIGVLISFLVI